MPTAVSLILIGTGLLLERPDVGIMRVVTSRGPGGVMLRRLALPAVLAPVLLGPVVTRALASLGVEDFPLVFAALSIAMTAVALLLLVASAPALNRAHEALEASRRQIRALIEQAPDGIFVADLDGRYTDVNSAGCRMLGYAREEILGKTIVDLIPPADVERLAQREAAAARGRDRGQRMDAAPQGRELPPRRGEREDPRRRPLAGLRARHQRAQASARSSFASRGSASSSRSEARTSPPGTGTSRPAR